MTVLDAIHPDHALVVRARAARIEDFGGAQNHVVGYDLDPDTRAVTIRYRQRATYLHHAVSAVPHEANLRAAFEGSELTEEVPEPEHVPNDRTQHRVPSRGDLASLRNALLSGRRPDAERRWRIYARFEGGKYTDADVREARSALSTYAAFRRGKVSARKALDLRDRLAVATESAR